MLALHGVEMERTGKPIEQEFETYRFSNVKFAATSFEGRVMLDFDAKPGEGENHDSRGIVLGPDEAAAGAADSVHAGAAGAGFARKVGISESGLRRRRTRGAVGEYLSEPIARRMMADSPELRKQFEAEARVRSAVRGGPRARLQWWFDQSKYQPGDNGRYPVVRVWEKNW